MASPGGEAATGRVRMINVHAEGEIGYVAVEGVPEIPGANLAQKLAWLNGGNSALRRQLSLGPRGNPASSVNLLVPPVDERADAAFLILQPDRAHASSGSNTICVATALLETGRVKMSEPETTLSLETAAGLVSVRAECRDGKCERVHLDMVPAYVEALDVKTESGDWGEVRSDICFGGVFYALVDAEQVGLSINAQNAARLSQAGMKLRAELGAKVKVAHPEIPEVNGIAYVMFREDAGEEGTLTATVMPPGRLDRSPCGTGSCAHLACLHARGSIKEGESITMRSVIGSRFEVTLVGTSDVAGRKAVLPRISGRGWRFGETIIETDASDAFAEGFAVTDVWGPGAGDL